MIRSLVFALLVCHAAAQHMGSRPTENPPSALPPLDARTAERYITIEGTAELRVEATAIRIVFAITNEGLDAESCRAENERRQKTFVQALAKAGFGPDAVEVDFISMLPVYGWSIEDQNGQRVAREKRTGFLMQTNVHVSAPNNATAQLAMRTGFTNGVTEVLAFDYWSAELEKHKAAARKRALQIAKEKADLLLSVFDTKPKLINIQSGDKALYPRSLYRSFQSAYAQSLQIPYRNRNVPQISAFRPKNFYYEGFALDVDSRDPRLPMKAEISVLSTIRLYYASPDRPKIHK